MESVYKLKYCQQIVKWLESGKSLASFSGNIGVARQTLYNWIDDHDEFKLAHDIGRSKGLEMFERLLMLAVLGKKVDAGDGQKTNINVPLLMFTLRSRYKEQYTENTSIDHNNPDGNLAQKAVIILPDNTPDDEDSSSTG